MRPIANFTFHAILAAAIAALATASAAAGKEEVYYTITLTEARAHDGGKGQQLEIHSFQWGSASQAQLKYKLDPVFVKSWSTSGDAAPPSGGGGNQMRAEDSAGGSEAKGTANGGRVTGIASDPADPAAGLATGKRQHMPMRTRGYYDTSTPPQNGSLTVLASLPNCRVGTRYPSLTLNGRGKSYTLHEVTVVSCGSAAADDRPTEEIAFYYNKISVRGWDPKKKEQ
jgi:type VI protein secretion system component Hcp